MKSAFSLLEIIIAVLIIGLISSVAIPKLLDTKDYASATTLKRDIFSIISSFQTYNLTAGSIESVEDVIELNESVWKVQDLKISDNSGCITIEVDTDTNIISLESLESETKTCKKLYDSGIITKDYRM